MTQLIAPYAVQESSITEGQIDFILSGAKNGFRTFGSAVPDGATFIYRIEHDATNEWEVGRATYNQAGNSLVRSGGIFAGTNGLNRVNFTSGAKTVSLVESNNVANFVDAGRFNPVLDNETDIPNAEDATTFVAGRRADASSNRAIAVGDDAAVSSSADDSIAIGTGAQCQQSDDSIAIGNRATANPAGTAFPFSAVAIGFKATAYARGLHAFSAGGIMATDIVRLSVQTTNATPDILDLDADGFTAGQPLEPVQDARPKTIAFEVHVVANNQTDNDAAYYIFNLLGHWNGTNFVQVGATAVTTPIEGASMTGASVTCSVTANQLQIEVTGIAAKTIDWGATVLATTLWHAGTPGSGVA